ncbi:glial cell line-derived neurotrophic factor [Etheostoma cragini]|uniref:glial cell line-derived neurotrophic factor n=1 Tax=Etheostoma cragini TaxID=417921 RepID=UPI00155F0325|nr:glial cell line-derived neurotrophic factor [Etheostoma cragini]
MEVTLLLWMGFESTTMAEVQRLRGLQLVLDGKTWWRQEASPPQHHLKNWKVSLFPDQPWGLGLYRQLARHRDHRHHFHVKELMEQDGSAFSFHIVMLWVVASLLTLVEDVFSEEDSKEAQSDFHRVLRQPSLSPAEDLTQHSMVHEPWPKALVEWSVMQEEDIQQSRWRRSPRDPDSPRTSRRNRKKTKSSRDCHLERKEIRVRDLGLGYDSDEIVLFKYCVGTCHSARKNYDLALKALMDKGSISDKRVSGHPCCRPTRYETVSFMDTQTTWRTIRWLSAANCSCVG